MSIRSFRMTRSQIVRTAVLTSVILAIVVALDYLVNVVAMPGVTPYTPLTTAAIVLLVTPAAIAYLILQNAKVQSATMALAEERVARIAADGANRAKTQFIANMSHELRTPLNAIIGYAEMIEEESTTASHKVCVEDAQRIQRSAHHLLGLITEILDHARLETGRLELRRSPTALEVVFNEVVEASRATAAANGNVLEAECAQDIGAAYLDPLRLRQCMLNLTSNAAKFTKDGRIRLSMRPAGDDGFVFEVADTGIGMGEATIAELFKPFVQADGSMTREHGGTGLGLAITKQLMDAMGGSVSVVSKPGEGAVFTLTLKRSYAGPNVLTLAA
jgi:signal transduction histidine kinase